MKPIPLSKRRPKRSDGYGNGGCVLAFLPKRERGKNDRHGWHSVHVGNLKTKEEQESLQRCLSDFNGSGKYTHWVPYPKPPKGK